MDNGTIAAITLGCILFFVLVAVYWHNRKYSMKKTRDPTTDMPSNPAASSRIDQVDTEFYSTEIEDFDRMLAEAAK